MSRKTFVQVTVLLLFLLTSLAIPRAVQAGGVCGGTYVVEAGQTLETIAAICGITVSDILAANPGLVTPVVPGQVLILPGSSTVPAATSSPVTATPTGDATYNTYNTYNYYGYPPSYMGIYVVRPGDTFSGIAYMYHVSVQELWAANPQIWNINYIYAGQVIYVPASAGPIVYPPPPWPGYPPAPTSEPSPSSTGSIPAGLLHGKMQLVNRSHENVYVSLQCSMGGYDIINGYTVKNLLNVTIPSGWYVYAAWIGGRKFEGQFSLANGGNRTMTFYKDRVVVE